MNMSPATGWTMGDYNTWLFANRALTVAECQRAWRERPRASGIFGVEFVNGVPVYTEDRST